MPPSSLEYPQAAFVVQGGKALFGEARLSGAKNSALPLLFSSLLAKGRHIFQNIPELSDIRSAAEILRSLGLSIKREGGLFVIENPGACGFAPDPLFTRRLRASLLCLGPLLAQERRCRMPFPGGCDLGGRPIDFHLQGLKAMGAKIEIQNETLFAKADSGLKGAAFRLPFPSVTGTENLIMAAVLAKGGTILQNCGIEPEILDLISCLKSMGAKIRRKGREIAIQGGGRLKPPGEPFSVPADRIEAGTLLLAGALTGGEVWLKNCPEERLSAVFKALRAAGAKIEGAKGAVLCKMKSRGRGLSLKTAPYPGFPTDLQAPFAALMTRLSSSSAIKEEVFKKRFSYVKEMKKMGAVMEVKDAALHVLPGPLKGAEAEAGDLRGGAGLALLGLAAEGEAKIHNAGHVLRGYERFEEKLRGLGASIRLEKLAKKEAFGVQKLTQDFGGHKL